MPREPWTEPYTLRERLSIRKAFVHYSIQTFRRSGGWEMLARHCPARLVYFITIRAFALAWADTQKIPSDLTFDDVIVSLENRKGVRLLEVD